MIGILIKWRELEEFSPSIFCYNMFFDVEEDVFFLVIG